MKYRYSVVIPFVCSTLAASLAAWADDAYELPETVITATRVPTPKTGLAALTTVITAEDIKNSPAQTLASILSTQAGVNIRSMDGSANASVDLRGFGTSSISNTLIMINGVVQNENDLSAPRISQIALASIERIEIVRGSGAVQYGGGATGGVINIITKSPLKNQPTLTVTAAAGSHNLRHLTADANVQSDNLGLNIVADWLDNDNYRDNNAEHQRSVLSTLSWKGERDKLSLTLGADDNNLRLPGSLSYAEWQANPRQTTTPNDWAAAHSQQQSLSYVHQGNGFELLLDASHREKHNDFYQSASLSHYKYGAETITPRVKFDLNTQDVKQVLVIGLDHSRNHNSGLNTGLQRQNAIFADDTLTFTDGSQVSVGARQQWVKDELSTGIEQHRLNAWQLASSKVLPAGWDVYGKVGHSFRVANADEQGYTLGSPLQPQTSDDVELGANWKSDQSSLRISVYRNNLKNEIHYNPQANAGSGANVNLAPTRRQGLELSYAIKPVSALQLSANATFQQAKFVEDGNGSVGIASKDVPLVPKRMLNLSAQWQVDDVTSLEGNVRYVSRQWMDGDEANTLPRQMPAYTLLDLSLAQQWKNWGWKVAVNNVFNKQYLTYATSYNPSTYVYSGAGRTVMLSLNYQFQ